MIRLLLSCIVTLLVTAAAIGQDRYTPIHPIPLGDTLLSLPTAHIPSEGRWEVKFTHRFNQSIDQGDLSDRIRSMFGLDGTADVGIGASYTFRQDLQISLVRSNALDDFEGALKYIVLQQSAALPVTIALRGGADWRTETDVRDRISMFAQAIVARQFGSRAELFAVPTFATKAGRGATGRRPGALFENAVNVPVGFAVLVRPGLSIAAEVIPRNRDLPESVEGDFGWAVGLKRVIGGHYFEVLLTNSSSTHVDQYISSTYMGAPLRRGDLKLGFNIERRFGRRSRQ